MQTARERKTGERVKYQLRALPARMGRGKQKDSLHLEIYGPAARLQSTVCGTEAEFSGAAVQQDGLPLAALILPFVTPKKNQQEESMKSFTCRALVLMMLRTGNDNPNTVSGGELAFRGILEQILPVRPRTKEFILGFPALFFGLFILHAAKYDPKNLGKFSGWVSLCIMLGVVGLTDSVNTLCHLHTPVMVSFLRDIIGLVIGGAFGLIAWLLLKKKVLVWLGTNNG